MTRFAAALRQLEDKSRLRSLTLPAGLDLTSNDYLGFSRHPALVAAARQALDDGMPVGATGSRLLRGQTLAHAELEEFAARYFGADKTLYFATGFQANHALFSTLPDRHSIIVYDDAIHASVRDGINSSPARGVKFRHNNLDDCEDALRRTRDGASDLWVAVESIYSMDGDMAPIADLAALCARYDAWLVIDEAHATGIFGTTGRGLTEGLPHDRLITLHTGGKALGVAGGLICAPSEIIDYLINRARPFIYSTAPPPLQAFLMQRALELSAAEPQHRARLLSLITQAQSVLPSSPSQIIPIIIGSDEAALRAAEALRTAGFDIRAIRPPTVPEGTARLRVSLNVGIGEGDIDRLAEELRSL